MKQKSNRDRTSEKNVARTNRIFHRMRKSVVVTVAIGAILYWLALPPVRWPWCAYLACWFWIRAIQQQREPSRREYLQFGLCGFGLWLALVQGIRLASWPLYGGWVALSAYLACYLPLFLGSARSLHHRYRFPLTLACPVAWVGFELVRSYFATGFSACMLAHSQTPWPWTLQLASHLGGYGVSWMVMFCVAAIYECWQLRNRCEDPWSWRLAVASSSSSIGCGVIMLLWSYLAYSNHERRIAEQSPIKPLGRILLVQGNMITQFDADPDEIAEVIQSDWDDYARLTLDAIDHTKEPIDLIVWPESVFSRNYPWIDWDHASLAPRAVFSGSVEKLATAEVNCIDAFQVKKRILSQAKPNARSNLLMGNDAWRVRGETMDSYNAALWYDGATGHVDYYGKQHLVMFGEYIPFLSSFPSVLEMIGLSALSRGEEPKAWPLPSGAMVSVSICFEDVLPHLIQKHVATLTRMGRSPDLLVNITNDGWFRGSSILDHHLNNAILCAVENRRPFLVAANNGISAWIDGNGRVIQTIAPLQLGTIVAEPIPDGRVGLWQWIGDWPARVVALIALIPAGVWLGSRFRWLRIPVRFKK